MTTPIFRMNGQYFGYISEGNLFDLTNKFIGITTENKFIGSSIVGSGKFIGNVGRGLLIGTAAVDAYKIVTAANGEEKQAAIDETKKDAGGAILDYGLSRIHPVLGVGSVMYDYYKSDKEFVTTQFNNLKNKADAKDATQADKKALYDYEEKNHSIIHGDKPTKETTVGPEK
ncbi:MAG: hypothetical protein ACYDEC_06165 [Bacteroidia bacterium]